MIQDKNLPHELACGSMVFAADESAPPWHVTRGMAAWQPFTETKTRSPALVHKLAWAIAIKLLALTAIWSICMSDQKVAVDAERASSHLLMRSLPNSNQEPGHDF